LTPRTVSCLTAPSEGEPIGRASDNSPKAETGRLLGQLYNQKEEIIPEGDLLSNVKYEHKDILLTGQTKYLSSVFSLVALFFQTFPRDLTRNVDFLGCKPQNNFTVMTAT
jgi:hypothetical protein